MATFDAKLITAVKHKRARLGLSLRAVSTQVGISFSTLARMERGEGSPDNNSKIRLIDWLGVEADEAGLTFDQMAFVHFRAMKNVQSGTVQSLLKAAACLKERYREENTEEQEADDIGEVADDVAASEEPERYPELSKDQLEAIVSRFRKDLGLKEGEAIDPLQIDVEGVRVIKLTASDCFDARTMRKLRDEACSEWSAMSVPIDYGAERWAVLLNNCHTVERQRVTLLEEYWHILMGHKLTKVARVAETYGRTYDKPEEHDAYYLASATLLPKSAMQAAVAKGQSADQIAAVYGTSTELVEYRIKRLGLWREHVGKKVVLTKR